MKIAYLGPEKTFTEKATKEIFSNEDNELIALQPIKRVIMAVEQGKVDYGVVPIENFYNGEVRETLDVLTNCENTKIIQEKALSIVFCLGCLEESSEKEIKEIYSKDQALQQSSNFLYENYENTREVAVSSTAEAVKLIKQNNLKTAGAIASEQALLNENFKILNKDICPNNKTRFVVLGKENIEKKQNKKYKTFLVIHPHNDKPGLLTSCLSFFSSLDINLEYIQSRPDGKKGYYFYLELNGHEKDVKVKKAIEAVKLSLDPENNFNDTIKILGSYENIFWKN